MRFQKLDLNLLVALDALLQERSVSLAADRIHLSQSATSSALGRLRDYFGDDLLVLKGRNMVPTARGEQLIEPVRALLEQIRDTITVPPPFDPATSDRRLSIMASDFAIEVLLSRALLMLELEAPRISFEICPLADDVVDELLRGRADLLVTIDTTISSDLPSVPLFEDDFVAMGWIDNPALADGMTRELYETLGHIVTRFGKSRTPAFDEWAIRGQVIFRNIEVIAPDFTSVGTLLAGSRRIATVHRSLASRMARALPLKIMEMPFQIPRIRQMAQWPPSSANDPAIAWLVARLQQVAQLPVGALPGDRALTD